MLTHNININCCKARRFRIHILLKIDEFGSYCILQSQTAIASNRVIYLTHSFPLSQQPTPDTHSHITASPKYSHHTFCRSLCHTHNKAHVALSYDLTPAPPHPHTHPHTLIPSYPHTCPHAYMPIPHTPSHPSHPPTLIPSYPTHTNTLIPPSSPPIPYHHHPTFTCPSPHSFTSITPSH